MDTSTYSGKIIESHAHYNMSPFNGNRKELILDFNKKGVEKIIISATGYESNFDIRDKFGQDPDYEGIIYYTAEVHPEFVCRFEETADIARQSEES